VQHSSRRVGERVGYLAGPTVIQPRPPALTTTHGFFIGCALGLISATGSGRRGRIVRQGRPAVRSLRASLEPRTGAQQRALAGRTRVRIAGPLDCRRVLAAQFIRPVHRVLLRRQKLADRCHQLQAVREGDGRRPARLQRRIRGQDSAEPQGRGPRRHSRAGLSGRPLQRAACPARHGRLHDHLRHGSVRW
jgi:hypothetical protein